MLCGLCTYLPGEELRAFGATCRRLKAIADKTAIGRIAYLLRKSDPLWARLHKGAVRQGLRSASSILAWMEVRIRNAHTKTNAPIVVTLDTGNPVHSLDDVDNLTTVDLFEEPKFAVDFKINDSTAAAAFFNKLPTLAVYTWDLFSTPHRTESGAGQGSKSEWSRRASRQILLDLSMFDIFDCEDPSLGTLHISGSHLALYLPCCDVLLLFDLSQSNNIQLEVLRLDQEFLSFIGYCQVDGNHYFVVDEEDGDTQWTSIYVKQGDLLNLYTRIQSATNNSSIVFQQLKIFLPSATEDVFFYQVQLEVEDNIDRLVKLEPKINYATEGCRFRLEMICSQVVAICSCSSHVCAFNLSTYKNLFPTSSRCLLELDTVLAPKTPPTRGIDYVVYFSNSKHSFFGHLGSWFRIWVDKTIKSEKWHFTPNAKIQLPSALGADANIYSTMLHSRSNCSTIYDYFPPNCCEAQSPMLNIFF